MLSLYIGPRNYVTGRGILNKIGEEVKKIAESVVLLYDKNVAEIEKNIEEYLNKSGIKYSAFFLFRQGVFINVGLNLGICGFCFIF